MHSLRVLTLNVRGVADPETRRKLFFSLRTWKADICCLQEVHATSPDQVRAWTNEWMGPAAWNNYTAILFKPSFGTPMFDVLYEGRVLSSTFRYRGQQLRIANIYMPANYTDRRNFLDDFTADFDSLFSSFDFLVGDWNMVPDPLLDRVSTATSNTQTISLWSHLAPCLGSFVNAALAGAATRFFTYESATHRCQSRIDHIFAHCRHALMTMDTTLTPFPYLDHSALAVCFSDVSSFTTPLLYRLNTSLLSSPALYDLTVSHFRPLRSVPAC